MVAGGRFPAPVRPLTVEASTWLIVPMGGGAPREVRTPERFDVHAVSRGFALGTVRDEPDISYAQVYRIVR